MSDKRNRKEKLKEKKSLFLESPHITLTGIIAMQPLSRDYVTIALHLSFRICLTEIFLRI